MSPLNHNPLWLLIEMHPQHLGVFLFPAILPPISWTCRTWLAFWFCICKNQSMPKRSRNTKRPRDTNLLAKSIVDAATGEDTEALPEDDAKNPAAVALGRLGGLKGGKARASKLSAKRRSEIAKNAAQARWSRRNA